MNAGSAKSGDDGGNGKGRDDDGGPTITRRQVEFLLYDLYHTGHRRGTFRWRDALPWYDLMVPWHDLSKVPWRKVLPWQDVASFRLMARWYDRIVAQAKGSQKGSKKGISKRGGKVQRRARGSAVSGTRRGR